MALVASIERVELGGGTAEATFKGHLKAIRKVTGLVAKRGLVAVAKGLTIGALDIDKEVEAVAAELAGDATGDLVDAFQREKDLLKKFREELDAAVKQLPIAGKRPTLVFFIDELDRCRPTFAIERLERVKHLFDVSNIVFVLSIDKQQLEASTAAVYGVGIKSAEYLRRFIDLEYGIPVAKTNAFTEALLTRFALDDAFAKRTASEAAYDRKNFVEVFTSLADLLGLSLRARERCITRLSVVLDQTLSEHRLDPILVALLIVLRSNKPDLFTRLADSQAAPKEVIDYLAGLPGGHKIVTDHMGIVLEAYLMAGDDNQDRTSARDAELKTIRQLPPGIARACPVVA